MMTLLEEKKKSVAVNDYAKDQVSISRYHRYGRTLRNTSVNAQRNWSDSTVRVSIILSILGRNRIQFWAWRSTLHDSEPVFLQQMDIFLVSVY
jgi:hypothetical protein